MNEKDEINQRLDDIISTLKNQDKSLFGIGLMVMGIGGVVFGSAFYIIFTFL